tara:strand:+ start:102 stop:1760 length:1659 start_codon:yes stop_codon:yes gene_type:complete
MVNPIIPVATLIARLNAARSKASKLNKELVTESMKPRTRKMKEKEFRETLERAKDLEKQIPPDTPGFAMGGGVMQRRTPVTSGLTNLLNKYNASGPLAGAGNVPRGTMPVQMNRGGRPDYSQYDRGDYVRSQTPGMGPAMMNPGLSFADIQAAAAEAAREQAAKAALPAEPVVSAPAPVQPVTAPFTPAPAPAPIPAPVSEPEPVVVAPTPVLEPLPPVIQDPLPPPPPVMETPLPSPPPVMETPLPSPPVIQDPPPVVDVVEPPIEEAPLPPIEEAPLPPPVYTPPQPTEVTVPTEPVFTPPPVAETPDLPDPGMLSDAVVDFDISDEITPQTEGYATTRGMNIAPTGDPFGDAIQGEYQMPIYRPQVAAGSMPFLSIRYGQPTTSSGQPPPPPRSQDYSTGSLGRANYAEALANWERLYGPVAEYQAPDTEAVMDDTASATSATASSGTNFYPEPPPVRGSGGIGPSTVYLTETLEWEQKYGPVEDYYAAQEAAQNNNINAYLSRQGEEAIAAQYGYTVEQLRSVNEDRRSQGLPPLGELVSGIDVNPSF